MQALTERFEMRLDQDTLRAVDSWRTKQSDLPSRAEAIRRLVERSLESEKAPPGRARLEFSRAELLMTHLMCELLKAPKKREIDPDFVQDALLGGHNWALEWDLSGLFPDRPDDPSMVTEVLNTLDMWDLIEIAHAKLDAKAKARVEKDAEPFGKNPRFHGFDGNNESRQMSIARFLIEKMDRFARFKGMELNSHMPVLESYRRMMALFEPMRGGLVGSTLSAEQIIELLNAMKYPSDDED
jgi:uncharacterized protein YfbU (UPF0304 family)